MVLSEKCLQWVKRLESEYMPKTTWHINERVENGVSVVNSVKVAMSCRRERRLLDFVGLQTPGKTDEKDNAPVSSVHERSLVTLFQCRRHSIE